MDRPRTLAAGLVFRADANPDADLLDGFLVALWFASHRTPQKSVGPVGAKTQGISVTPRCLSGSNSIGVQDREIGASPIPFLSQWTDLGLSPRAWSSVLTRIQMPTCLMGFSSRCGSLRIGLLKKA